MQRKGGLGKTVMLGDIVEDRRVRTHFDSIVYVSLGQHPDATAIIGSMYDQLGGDAVLGSRYDMSASTESASSATPGGGGGGGGDAASSAEKLQMLARAAATKSILLVLDDVWDAEDAQALNFVVYSRTSRLLVASRSNAVVPHAIAVAVTPVDDADSARLLLQSADTLNDSDDLAVSVASAINEIAGQCCGSIPLFVTIGGRIVSGYVESGETDWPDKVLELFNTERPTILNDRVTSISQCWNDVDAETDCNAGVDGGVDGGGLVHPAPPEHAATATPHPAGTSDSGSNAVANRVIGAALARLRPREAEAATEILLCLALAPRDVAVSFAAVAVLWEHGGGELSTRAPTPLLHGLVDGHVGGGDPVGSAGAAAKIKLLEALTALCNLGLASLAARGGYLQPGVVRDYARAMMADQLGFRQRSILRGLFAHAPDGDRSTRWPGSAAQGEIADTTYGQLNVYTTTALEFHMREAFGDPDRISLDDEIALWIDPVPADFMSDFAFVCALNVLGAATLKRLGSDAAARGDHRRAGLYAGILGQVHIAGVLADTSDLDAVDRLRMGTETLAVAAGHYMKLANPPVGTLFEQVVFIAELAKASSAHAHARHGELISERFKLWMAKVLAALQGGDHAGGGRGVGGGTVATAAVALAERLAMYKSLCEIFYTVFTAHSGWYPGASSKHLDASAQLLTAQAAIGMAKCYERVMMCHSGDGDGGGTQMSVEDWRYSQYILVVMSGGLAGRMGATFHFQDEAGYLDHYVTHELSKAFLAQCKDADVDCPLSRGCLMGTIGGMTFVAPSLLPLPDLRRRRLQRRF